MRMIVLLILSLGAFGAIYGSKCIPETMVCHPYRVKMEPHKNLMESEEELNSWCRQQFLFFSCLEDVLLGKYGNYSELPTNILVSKMFSEDLCLEGSPNRKRYLDNAACINQLDLEYCKLPEYLDIIIPDGSAPPSKCSLAEKTFSCIAASMVLKCGFDAGRVYRYLLKVIKHGEEVCDVEDSDGVICEEVPDSKKDQMSGIYYGLVHRFGFIPEQEIEAGSEVETESTFLSDESISEAINKALDAIEDSTEGDILSERITFNKSEVHRNTDEFYKKPVITEPFKGLLFYNYSDEEFAFYWSQPGSFPISRVTCGNRHLSELPFIYFQCILHYGYEEPECAEPTETNERITPELIRDIDISVPEDSSVDISKSPDWAPFLHDYKRYRLSWSFFANAKFTSEEESVRELNREMHLEYPNNFCAKEIRFHDIINNQDIDWWQCPNLFTDELRNEILIFLFKNQSKDTDIFILTSNSLNRTDEDFKTFIDFYDPLFHGFEKIVCERVNECHPRGKGVIKCSLERRGIEGCDSCCVEWPVYAKLCEKPRNLMESENEDQFSRASTSSEEGSGSF